MRRSASHYRFAVAGMLAVMLIMSGGRAASANQPADGPAQDGTEDNFSQEHDRAVAAYLKGRFDEALRGLDRAIAINPRVELAHYNRGNVRFALKDPAGAIVDYSEAIRLKPDFALALMNRGSAYSNLWRLDEALSDLDETVRLEPKLPDAFFNRAIVLIKRGEISRAMTDYERLLDLDRSLTDNRAGARLKQLMDREDSGYVPDDPARLTSELAHGRLTEYLLTLLERSCLAAGNDPAALARVAGDESWSPVPAGRIKKEPGGENVVGGWAHRFLDSVYYVIQSMPDDGRHTVCSVSAMPFSEHMLEDFKVSLQDKLKVTHAGDRNAQDRLEASYAMTLSASSQPRDLQVVHRKSVRFITLRTVFPRP